MADRRERSVAMVLQAARWILAPCYLGLVVALAIVLVAFVRELVHAVLGIAAMTGAEVILAVLKLIDLLLVGNLVLLILAAGAELVGARPGERGDERGFGIGAVDLGALKLKLVAAIIAIAAVQLLETFMNVAASDKSTVLWEILVLLAIAIVGVLLAWMDRLGAKPPHR
jgi:uncharacterized protein (TIGR00645 family)